MNELALFAGGGGGLLGSRLLGWRAVCYVERDAYCVEVLQARIRDGYLHDAPIWDDARIFDGRPWAGSVDIVTAGFPCQPFSVAGRGLAELDERNLWPDTIRIIREVCPEWCLLENVPGLFAKPYIKRIFADLAESGFDVRWDRFSAAGVGAPHFRARQWLVAHAKIKRGLRVAVEREQEREGTDAVRPGERVANTQEPRLEERRQGKRSQRASNEALSDPNGRGRLGGQDDEGQEASGRGRSATSGKDVADPGAHSLALIGQQGEGEAERLGGGSPADDSGQFWAVEPELGRVAYGVANRVDRLRAIGNGQVPAVVRRAWRELSE